MNTVKSNPERDINREYARKEKNFNRGYARYGHA